MMEFLHEARMHSLSEIFGMLFSFLWTRIFFPKALLIRRPFYKRGKRKSIDLGKGTILGRGCRFETYGNGHISIGEDCHIGDYVRITCSNLVEIGNNCLFASKILITDSSHGNYSSFGDTQTDPESPPNERPLVFSSTSIGKNVWIGENVVVLPGTKIGNGCIIGANSTVSKSIPDYCIAAGSPAKPIKKYNFGTGKWERVA